MLLRFFISLSLSTFYVIAQGKAQGTCTIWGDPHLVSFPVAVNQASLRSGYWCHYTGRMLILKNDFIEFFVNTTDSPYWNEYYEIKFLLNGTILCTVTPDSENCPRNLMQLYQPRNSPSSRQLFYSLADDMEVSIMSQWNNGRLTYNIDVSQSYDLILASTGLCVTRLPQCTVETSSPGRRKRSTDETNAYKACDLYIYEANKTAKQITGDIKSELITHAREGCVTDILLTKDPSWGESAVWLVLTDSIRQAGLTVAQRTELMMDLPSSIATAVRKAKTAAEVIMGITTTTVMSNTTEITFENATTVSNNTTVNTTMQTTSVPTTSASNEQKFNIIIGLLTLVLLMIFSIFPRD